MLEHFYYFKIKYNKIIIEECGLKYIAINLKYLKLIF